MLNFSKIFVSFLIIFLLGACNKSHTINTKPIPLDYLQQEKALIYKGVQASLLIEAAVINEELYLDTGNLDIITQWGTGGRISENGDILTAHHVIDGAIGIRAHVFTFDPFTNTKQLTNTIPLTIKKIFVNEDVAILTPKISDLNKLAPPLQIENDSWTVSLDKEYYMFGFATGWQKAYPTDPTYILMGPTNEKPVAFCLYPVVQSGDSGGFVLNKNGNVVGIILAKNPGKFTIVRQ